MNKLREIRQKENMTALSLGNASAVKEMRIFHLERGRFAPHPDEAKRIASALKRPVEAIWPDLEGEVLR